MEQTDEAIAKVLNAVSEALANAATKYGAETVDLALVAVRLQVMGGQAQAVLLLVGYAVVIHKIIKMVRKKQIDIGSMLWEPLLFFVGLPALALGFVAFVTLISPTRWAAVFGHPEIYIASKALQAAGLM